MSSLLPENKGSNMYFLKVIKLDIIPTKDSFLSKNKLTNFNNHFQIY